MYTCESYSELFQIFTVWVMISNKWIRTSIWLPTHLFHVVRVGWPHGVRGWGPAGSGSNALLYHNLKSWTFNLWNTEEWLDLSVIIDWVKNCAQMWFPTNSTLYHNLKSWTFNLWNTEDLLDVSVHPTLWFVKDLWPNEVLTQRIALPQPEILNLQSIGLLEYYLC